MSFTLGNKEAIVNNSASYPLVGNTNPAQGPASVRAFVNGDLSQVTSAIAQRFQAEKLEIGVFSAPSADAIGVETGELRVPVKALLRVNTARHSSEYATDFILRGRPFVFELSIDDGDTDAEVAAKLAEAFTAYETAFTLSDAGLPFSWSVTDEVISATAKEGHLSFGAEVEFLRDKDVFGLKMPVSNFTDIAETIVVTGTTVKFSVSVADEDIRIGDSIMDSAGVASAVVSVLSATPTVVEVAESGLTAGAVSLERKGTEPLDGKYLEENVKMGTALNSMPYEINAGEGSVIAGGYTMVTFKLPGGTGDYKGHANLGSQAGVGTVSGATEQTFTLYFLEGSDNFATGSNLDTLIDKLQLSSNLTASLADGTVVTTGAAFVA